MDEQDTPTELFEKIEQLKLKNREYNKKIERNKKLIQRVEHELFKSCNHEWERDPFANFDDHIKFICKKCKLYNCSYLYEIR